MCQHAAGDYNIRSMSYGTLRQGYMHDTPISTFVAINGPILPSCATPQQDYAINPSKRKYTSKGSGTLFLGTLFSSGSIAPQPKNTAVQHFSTL